MILSKIFSNKTMRAAYLAWFSIALFYLYQYTLRVSPNVLVEELRSAYAINANEFATLGSLYLFAYAILQVPLGIIVDRVGVKKVVVFSIFSCVIGSLLFTSTNHFFVAQISRIMIGAGSASAFMCSLKFVADHFPPGKRGLLMGLTLALGTAGSLITAKSIEFVNEFFTWRDIMAISAGLGMVVYLMILFFVKDASEDPISKLNHKNFSGIVASILTICKNKYIMIYALLAIGLYTPLSTLADLWGSAFIMQKFGLAKDQAAMTSMYLYIGLTFGSIFLPWLSEKYDRLNESIIFCGLGILSIFIVVLYLPPVDHNTLRVLFFALGFLCGAEMMCFTGALVYSKKMDSGEIIGVVNTFNMMAGAFLGQIIGWALDLQWSGELNAAGLRVYSTAEFERALTSMTIIVGACSLLSFMLLGAKRAKQAN